MPRLFLILAAILALNACQTPAASRSSAPAAYRQLVSLIGERLALAEQVAAAKFVRGLPIEDAERENALLISLMRRGESMSVPESVTFRFFEGQIAASKQIQQSRFALWRSGSAAPPPAPDLVRSLRPRIDRIDRAMLAAIALAQQDPLPPPTRLVYRDEAVATLRAQGFPEAAAESAAQPLVDL